MSKRLEMRVGQYHVIGAVIKGSAKAIAYKGKPPKKEFGSEGVTVEEAVKNVCDMVKARQELLSRGRRKDGGFEIGATEEFLEALQMIDLNSKERSMLKAHTFAPGATLTTAEIAAAADYKEFSSANMHYGKLGRKIGEMMGIKAPKGIRGNVTVYTRYLAWGDEDQPHDQHWRWTMYPELVEALKRLPI